MDENNSKQIEIRTLLDDSENIVIWPITRADAVQRQNNSSVETSLQIAEDALTRCVYIGEEEDVDIGDLNPTTPIPGNGGAVTSVNGKTGNIVLNASDVGARPDTWTPTASDVGARPDTWTPTASDVGARPDTWTPTADEVGAIQNGTIAGQDVYTIYENNSDVSADSLEHTYVLLSIDGANNTTLRSILNENFAYIHTVMYASTQQKMQIAVGYVAGRMAVRSCYRGNWSPWAGVYDTLHKPSPSDIGARPNTWTPTASDVGAVPTSRTINSKALQSNIILSASDIKLSDNTTIQATINDLKTSVSNGKSAVASAITDKGVSTSATASFDTMASNIRSISGIESLPGTLLAEDKTGYDFYPNLTRVIDLSKYNYSKFLVIAGAGAHGSYPCGNGFGLWIIDNLVINQLVRYVGMWNASVSLSISGSTITLSFGGGNSTSVSYNLFGIS